MLAPNVASRKIRAQVCEPRCFSLLEQVLRPVHAISLMAALHAMVMTKEREREEERKSKEGRAAPSCQGFPSIQPGQELPISSGKDSGQNPERVW